MIMPAEAPKSFHIETFCPIFREKKISAQTIKHTLVNSFSLNMQKEQVEF